MVHEIHETREKILYADEVFRIQDALFEVYRTMGAGFLEAVYQECVALEFGTRSVPFVAQRTLRLEYKGRALRQSYTPDFICYDKIIVELKALGGLAPEHRAQVVNYLRASGLRLGLLVNFGVAGGVQIVRLAL